MKSMSRLVLERECFVFCDETQRINILDLTDNFANKSRIPLRSKELGELSIAGLLLIMQEYNKRMNGGEEGKLPIDLMNVLVTQQLIRTSAPINVVEMGAINGLDSYYLSTIMGMINEESQLCSVCHVIGNESGNRWLDYICMVEHPPILSMLVSDYDRTRLERGGFELAIINGGVDYEKPLEMVKEIKQLLKKEGAMICHVLNDSQLESAVWEEFKKEDSTVYSLSENEKIIVAIQKEEQRDNPNAQLRKKALEILDAIECALNGDGENEKLRPLIKQIDYCAKQATTMWDTKCKDGLVCLKEAVMNYMLNKQERHFIYYRDELVRCMTKIEMDLK